MKRYCKSGISIIACLVMSKGLIAQVNSVENKKKVVLIAPAEVTYPKGEGIMGISPNPASEWIELWLHLPDPSGFTLEVFNSKGACLISQDWRNQKISVASLSPGLYVFRLKRNKECYSRKLLVKR